MKPPIARQPIEVAENYPDEKATDVSVAVRVRMNILKRAYRLSDISRQGNIGVGGRQGLSPKLVLKNS